MNGYLQFSSAKKESLLWSSKGGWQTRKKEMGWCEVKTRSNIFYDANHNHIFKNQEKAYKYFYSLSQKEQDKLVKQFEKEKITSDIFKTIYKKDWIEETVSRVMFGDWIWL